MGMRRKALQREGQVSTRDGRDHLGTQEKGPKQTPPSWPSEGICPAGTLTLDAFRTGGDELAVV